MTYGLTTLVTELRGRGDDLSLAAADKLEAQAEKLAEGWRPIEEVPADHEDGYLCVMIDERGQRTIDTKVMINRFDRNNGITHWMPLPELPDE